MDKAINFRYGGATIYRMTAIGARLRELRKSLKLGQDDVADEIGVTQSMISDYESKGVMFGADKPPKRRLFHACKIAFSY